MTPKTCLTGDHIAKPVELYLCGARPLMVASSSQIDIIIEAVFNKSCIQVGMCSNRRLRSAC